MPQLSYPEFSWQTAGTKSKPQSVNGATVFGLRVPAGFAGTSVTFEAAEKFDGAYMPVTNADGTNYTLTVAASRHVRIPPADLAGCEFIKVVSGASEAAGTKVNAVAREAL